MDKQREKAIKRKRIQKKIRTKIKGTAKRPRLNVFKSNRELFAQIIDDTNGKTIVSAYSREIKSVKKDVKNRKVEIGHELGRLLAGRAVEKKIGQVVFDRGGIKYHGRIKAVAEGARKGGLKF